MNKTFALFSLLMTGLLTSGQNKPFVTLPEQLDDSRFAEWIIPDENEGVFYFRKILKLESEPGRFVVHTSADARYRLYVNGLPATWGPAVGDSENWNYETTDIAPLLKKGENLIAAQVWNWGPLNGTRQQSLRTAFILQGDSDEEHEANTNQSWKVKKDAGYHVLDMDRATVGGGYIAGGTDSLIAARHPWGWNQASFDDSDWKQAKEMGKGNHSGLDTWKGTAWKLKSRELPSMEQKKEPIAELLEAEGIPFPGYSDKKLSVEIPANSRVEILLDNRVLTMGFPQLYVSGGKNSKIKIQYQEALFNADGTKGNRNDWQGKTMKGYYDIFIHDGEERRFEPLWIRVFRFVKLTIETQDEPLKINDFYNIYTAYPLKQKGSFAVEDEMLNQIWETSWRTLRLCALETYMDCPYYEQVQYIGDTRIQALVSMYVAGEDRLAKNAIQQFYNSMQPMGLTKSAHPTNGVQIIPPFSLYFIGMVNDYYMLRDDPDFVRQFIPGIKFVLEWFIGRIAENGMLGPLPYWNHIDGGTDFTNGSPPGISDGGSAHMTILLAYALDKAAELLNRFDFPCDGERFLKISKSLKQHTIDLCFSEEKKLIAETPAKEQFSQHTNIFAILTNTLNTEVQHEIAQRILNDQSLIQTTLYFKFYLFQALKKAGLGEKVIDQMQEWEKFLDAGLTTFPEHGINSRSDCHAWAAHPMYDFLNITCGIEPDSPGFKTVKIEPNPGNLSEFEGKMFHPSGEISVSYKSDRKNKKEFIVRLPHGLSGTFVFQGITFPLTEGENVF
jgi:alpha-L-rhamnosidase